MIVHTQGDKIIVSLEIGHVFQRPVTVSSGRVVDRWFHDLSEPVTEMDKLGWMKKRDALKDAQRVWASRNGEVILKLAI